MASIDSTFTGIINTVFKKAAPHLTPDELSTLEMQGEVGKYTILHLASHIEGLACLISSDSDNRCGAGSFQHPDSLFSLLLSIQQTLEGAHARLDLADIALHERERRRYELLTEASAITTVPSHKQVADALCKLGADRGCGNQGREVIQRVLSQFGASKLADVPPSDYEKVIAACAEYSTTTAH